jgi:hypothetical protein
MQSLAQTAEEIDAAVRPVGASLERAIATCTLLRYNCDGFMNDRLAAEVGALCGQLASKAIEQATEWRASNVRFQRELSDARKEIEALKAKPARKPRAVKSA